MVAPWSEDLRRPQGRTIVNFSGHTGPMECVAVSLARRHLLAGGNDGSVMLWQADQPDPVEVFPRHPNKTRAVKGHEFGLGLQPEEKSALIAFLKTL